MGAICGMLGNCDASVARSMARALAHRGEVRLEELPGAVLASSEPAAAGAAVCDGTPRDAHHRAMSIDEALAACRDAGAPDRLRLRGAFAGVFRVDKGRAWWLIRDRLGRRPLYYYQGPDYLLFASELKGLLASGLIEKRLNLLSVDRYLTLRCVPGPETIFQEVRRVSPGHVVEYARNTATEIRYARFGIETRHTTREAAAGQVRDLLGEATARCAAGDVLWSGGMDCAALGALRSELRPVFATLDRAWQDEGRSAEESARRLGLRLDKVAARRLSEDEIRRAVYALDEPLADASALPLWLVMRAASKVSRAFVSGYGADELLGGYPRFHLLQRAQGAQGLIPVNLLSGISPSLPPNAFIRRGSRYLSNMRANPQAFLSFLSVFEDEERDELYTDAMKSALHDLGGWSQVVKAHFGAGSLMDNLLSLDLHVEFPDHLIAKCDRIAAAHGVTMEYPYLDDALVDYAAGLPPRVKFGMRSKPVLRLAMRGVLPGRIRLRARRGFRVPQSGRVVGVIEDYARATVTHDRVEATGLFKWPYVERVMQSASHNVYRRRQYWALLMFFAWYREFMES